MALDLDRDLAKWRRGRWKNRAMLAGASLLLLALAFVAGFDWGSSAGYRHGYADGKKPDFYGGRPPALMDELNS